MEQSSSLESTTIEKKPVAALKLRTVDNSNRGATLGLDIGKKYPKIPFTPGTLCCRVVTEKSGIVKKEGNGKLFKRVILLTTFFGKVNVTIPKGQTIQNSLTSKNSLDFYNARHIVVLTKEKQPWALWWRTTSGKIISFRDGERITTYLEGLAMGVGLE